MWLLRPIRLEGCKDLRQFVRRILAQQFALKIPVAMLLVAFIPIPDADVQTTFVQKDPLFALLAMLVLAPIVETLLLQSALIEPLRLFRRSRTAQFLAGSIPFALLHFPNGIHSGVAAGIVGGLYFSHTYLECRGRSWWVSTSVTATTQCLHILFVAPLAFATALG
jgi:membrane protease YdiL (CAAX protease family)